MDTENNNQNQSNTADWVEHAKKYIETQKENNEEPTKEGWYQTLIKEDLVGAWDEMIETFKDTWEVTNTMIDSMFGISKESK
ncbi:MAG: hypothetical protein JST62_04230 [Bacteroidetes bacterium]|nr:hypothetical protein [Bacteroidota bacterium]